MKVSLNLAQAHSNTALNEIGTEELVRKIGAQLGAVEEVIEYGPRYDGIVVVSVVACQKHPNADKLSVCMIDDGGVVQGVERDSNGHVQVVCGAPNVREGLTVAWLPPGSTVPSTLDKDPFVLEPRELRGVVSNGMLASPAELGISDNHDGILEITAADVGEDLLKPGTPFKQLYGLDDVVIDIENKMFTHRPDCFGVLGVARELAGIQGKQFSSPEWYLHGEVTKLDTATTHLNITVDTNLVSRFMAVAMENVTVGPSPVWLQASLARVGLKSINNIVDITNYLMYVTGQPLHAYDADKLPTPGNLGARMSKQGEKVNLLNGKELELQDDSTVVIVSGDTVVGVGGAMGGRDTEVSQETKNIIIECATFDMYNIRRTSMKYGLFTDAVTRFNKGQSPLQNQAVLAQAVKMVSELASGQQASDVADVHSGLPSLPSVRVGADFINERLGSELSGSDMATLLGNVEFHVVADGELQVAAPFWRTDIEIPEDVVEEVGRLYGFDNLPLVLPTRPARPTRRNALLDLKTRLRDVLSAAGANEVLTYSFIHGNLFEKATQNAEHAFQLSNAISPDLQYFRTSLTPSLLERVHPNIKAGFDQFVLFEMGTVHNKLHSFHDDGLPKEFPVLSVVTAAASATQPAYYEARAYLDYLMNSLDIPVRYQAITVENDDPTLQPFDITRSALVVHKVSGETLGIIGEFKQRTQKALKLPVATAGFELDLPTLTTVEKTNSYTKLSKYPSVQQDISLRVPVDVPYQALFDVLNDALTTAPHTTAQLEPLDSFQREGDTTHKQLAFRLTIAHYDKTLMSEEVNTLLERAAATVKDKFSAERL